MKYFNVDSIINRLKSEIKINNKQKLFILTDENSDNLSYCSSIKRTSEKNNWFEVQTLKDWNNVPLQNNDKIFIMNSLINNSSVKLLINNLKNIDFYSEILDNCIKITPTPDAIIDICKEYVGKDDLVGKHIVVISRSKLIGRPVIDKLLDLNAAVFCAHSKTNLELLDEMKSKADIIITACGKPNSFWLNDNYKKGLLIVDAGINVVDGKVVGDWKYETLQDKDIVITANPGGVGKVTTYELFKELSRKG